MMFVSGHIMFAFDVQCTNAILTSDVKSTHILRILHVCEYGISFAHTCSVRVWGRSVKSLCGNAVCVCCSFW